MLIWLSYAACVALALAGLYLFGRLLDKWAVAHFTVLNELGELGSERKGEGKLNGTAVVCGGRYIKAGIMLNCPHRLTLWAPCSVAGLLAARVCSFHFKDVLIIDPDNELLVSQAQRSLGLLPEANVDEEFGRHARPRVSQTNIIHVNQGEGRAHCCSTTANIPPVLNFMALERIFPDFRKWLKTLRVPYAPSATGIQYRALTCL